MKPHAVLVAPCVLRRPVAALRLYVLGEGLVDCAGHAVWFGALLDHRADKGAAPLVRRGPDSIDARSRA